jgi:hypothetical protein
MNKEKPETRICCRSLPTGEYKLVLYSPCNGRVIPTGIKCRKDALEQKIREVKLQLEKAGNYVTVVEM